MKYIALFIGSLEWIFRELSYFFKKLKYKIQDFMRREYIDKEVRSKSEKVMHEYFSESKRLMTRSEVEDSGNKFNASFLYIDDGINYVCCQPHGIVITPKSGNFITRTP